MSGQAKGKVLVVGATGQLGGLVVKKLASRGVAVRALSRPRSDHSHLKMQGVEIVLGDLLDSSSLSAACEGADVVISTATAHIPRFPEDDFRLVDDLGYANLIDACRRRGVS